MIATAALGLGVTAAAASAGPAPVGTSPLTILKTVNGPVPAGTTFTAVVECDDEIIFTGGPGSTSATVTFDASGQPTSPDIITFEDAGTCTVTETVAGGAATTTYSCEGAFADSASAVLPEQPICATAGPQADPIAVNIIVKNQTATVTIANMFVAPVPTPTPTPSPAVVARPTFTG